jgi:hypothetical protein
MCNMILWYNSTEESHQTRVDIVYKWSSWYFAYLIGFNYHIFQIQIYYFNASHATDVELHGVRDYFSFYPVKCEEY